MNHIEVGKYKISIPERWEELTEKQTLRILSLYVVGEFSFYIIKAHALKIFFGHRAFLLRKLTDVQIAQLTLLLDWLNEKLPSRALIKRLHHKGTVYYAPPEGLAEVTAIEFDFLLRLVKDLEKNEKNLDTFCAVLYRPEFHPESSEERKDKAAKNDLREPLHSKGIKEREQLFRSLKPEYKIAGLFYFIANFQRLREHPVYKVIFQGSGKKGYSLGWAGTFVDIAENGAMGTLQQVKESSISEVLLFLAKKEMDRREYERNKPRKR